MDKSNPSALRAAQAGSVKPSGPARMHRFPGEIRASLINRDGRNFYQVEGYASVFNVEYEMWDAFGSYTESVDSNAFSKSLANDPDVAFLTNHRGVTMARTTNGTLDVFADSVGLGVKALLNADRQDVRDLASAINDKLIDQMSFAFILNEGDWNKDFDRFRITEADINRGDVSAVNYGASPYTSIEARASEWLADAERVSLPLARAALGRLAVRLGSSGSVPAASRALTSMDTDESVTELMAALDATLDSASDLVVGLDPTGLPPEVAQALDLLTGAEAIADQLMDLLNIDDPDDTDPEPRGASVALVMRRLLALDER